MIELVQKVAVVTTIGVISGLLSREVGFLPVAALLVLLLAAAGCCSIQRSMEKVVGKRR